MSAKKPRIDTNPVQAGLNAAFANLEISSLPEGPAEPLPVKEEKALRLGRVVLRKETAHRGGKTVIVIDDFEPQIPDAMIEHLAREIRSACGTGGTVSGRTIEIQGNQPEKIRAILKDKGFRVAGV